MPFLSPNQQCQGTQNSKTEQTRCVAMPSLMAARWAGPIFRRLWTKVHLINFAYAGVSVFRLMTSCCVPEIFVIKSRTCAKSRQNFHFSGPPNFVRGRGHPNFWRNFISLGHHQTCGKVRWRPAKRPRRLGGDKKDLNDSSETEWTAAIIIRW